MTDISETSDHHPKPRKYRPSAGWFVVGLALFLLAIALAIALFTYVLIAFFDSDATVDADGRPHRVSVSTDGDRMLWLVDDDTRCRVADASTGQEIALRPVTDDYERSESGDDLEGIYKFSPGSGDLEITCVAPAGTDPDNEVVITSVPALANFAIGVVVTIVIPGLLALVGLVILIWTGILWSLRQPRPKGS